MWAKLFLDSILLLVLKKRPMKICAKFELNWSITTATEVVLGRMKTTREEEWFDEEYRKALDERNQARLAYLEEYKDTNRHLYTTERSKWRKMARKKKREVENAKIGKIEVLRERNYTRLFRFLEEFRFSP
ncbi:unnamed protein product [Euphydryas editha]|uniref:Uncharacterized protein n=1 Tax=Euphydryas editha TaxID=104508 RepID=A0AAU9V9M6_EUPED|nr:unnamed protein product [Euphydryas editha]